MSYTPQIPDNKQLYSNTINTIGAITGIDVTGFSSISAQISGVWQGNLIFEGSNDNTNWQPILTTDLDTFFISDTISDNGFIGARTYFKFVRVNVLRLDSGTITILILGKIGAGVNAADILSLAMDKANVSPLYIEDINGPFKKDINSAAIPSDAPKPIVLTLFNTINSFSQIIDTTGYQSISAQVSNVLGTMVFQQSNDSVSWTNVVGHPISAALADNVTILTNNILYIIPAYGRYFRVFCTATNSGSLATATCYLRQQSVATNGIALPINITQTAGNAVLSSGLAGGLAVGGGNNVGITANVFPVTIGGVDSGLLVRRLLTDTGGRLITNINTASTDQSGIARNLGSLSPYSNPYNIASLATQDVNQLEGQSSIELLKEILKEIKLLNWYTSQMSEQDEPSIFRNDFENSLAN